MYDLYIQLAFTYRLPLREVAKMAGVMEEEIYNAVLENRSYRYAFQYLAYETSNLSKEQLLSRKKQAKLVLFQLVYAKRNGDSASEKQLIQQLLVIDKNYQHVKRCFYKSRTLSREDGMCIILHCLKYGITYHQALLEFGYTSRFLFNLEKYFDDDEIQRRLSLFHEFGKLLFEDERKNNNSRR